MIADSWPRFGWESLYSKTQLGIPSSPIRIHFSYENHQRWPWNQLSSFQADGFQERVGFQTNVTEMIGWHEFCFFGWLQISSFVPQPLKRRQSIVPHALTPGKLRLNLFSWKAYVCTLHIHLVRIYTILYIYINDYIYIYTYVVMWIVLLETWYKLMCSSSFSDLTYCDQHVLFPFAQQPILFL